MGSYEVQPKILIIDSYDSFTHNLAALVKEAIPGSSIHIIKNDEISFACLSRYLPFFSAVLVGPGPGSPLVPSDIGITKRLWKISNDLLLPVLGVCLGLQSLGVEHGATLEKLKVVKHGQVSRLLHNGDDFFEGVPMDATVVRYHSLCVDTNASEELEDLAWADDEENGRVVMALKHTFKPFWAVQYHPESVCTDGSGFRIVQNFWRLACDWTLKNDRKVKVWDDAAQSQFFGNVWPSPRRAGTSRPSFEPQRVAFSKLSLPQLSLPQICEVLGVYKADTDFILLDSAAQPGSHSIIGCIHPSTIKIQYFVGDTSVTLIQGKRRTSCALGSSDIWTWLASFMRTKEAVGGDPHSPFWGGLTGYLSYELGVDSIQCRRPSHDETYKGFPDVNLVFIERSIVINVNSSQVLIQSLLPKDDDWFAFIASTLRRSANGEEKAHRFRTPLRLSSTEKPTVLYPNKDQYILKVKEAQDYLFAGESYELCLTARTHIVVPRTPVSSSQSSWELYKRLRSVNPAPYAAYLRLGSVTLISSSPERFLSYSRPPSTRLQLRPIKGTVKKGGGITRERAEEILSSPKEIGENLMIVDLIRHDLYGVVGAGVDVKKFCGIEEYETVWQLVSVIEGELRPSAPADCDVGSVNLCDDQLGWNVLHQSLPPGSMTGAPKKRSVQLLQSLEDSERGIYSGVVGYWCVGGGGDWSVVIRSCFKDDERHRSAKTSSGRDTEYDEWIVGAGGAITALSDPESEWDEMLTKLQSVLRAFHMDDSKYLSS
ncbi:hypothetical protein M0805_003779 [Coniferiporia weirii]|nr:hypothetical protein M0805_003779 [Coniferiporia weirii]